VFKGGVGYNQLLEFCEKYDLVPSEYFHGFRVGTNRFLYRRANCNTIYQNDKEWPRWDWKNPLGPKAQRTFYQNIFLYGPEHGDRERIFLFTRGEFEVYIQKYPKIEFRLNIPSVITESYKEHTEWVYNHEVDWPKKLLQLSA